MGDGVKLKEGRNETDQSLRSRRRTTRSENNEIEKDGNCRSDEGEGERMIDDRRKESESERGRASSERATWRVDRRVQNDVVSVRRGELGERWKFGMVQL